MASSQDKKISMDKNMPLWKRELILRKRASGQAQQSGNSSVPLSYTNTSVAVTKTSELSKAAVEDVTTKQLRSTPSSLRATNEESLDQAQADFHPRGGRNNVSFSPPAGVRSAVGSNMRLVEHLTDSGSGLLINGVGGVSNSSVVPLTVKYYSSKMGEEKFGKRSSVSSKSAMDNIARNRILNENNNLKNVENEDYQSDSSEELQYGPGIVSKLKNKYLSLTLRENKNRGVRPSLSNIRKYSSLENILDSDLETGKPQITNQHFIKKTDINNASKTEPSHQQRYRSANRRKESMKRARSVETLHKYDNRVQIVSQDTSTESSATTTNKNLVRDVNKNRPTSAVNPLINEELVIIENKMKMDSAKRTEKVPTQTIKVHVKRVQLGVIPAEGELPPPDTVNQRLKIFENSSGRKFVTRPHPLGKVNSAIHNRSNNTSSHPTNINYSGIPKTQSANIKAALPPKPNLTEKPRHSVTSHLVRAVPYNNTSADMNPSPPNVTRPTALQFDTVRTKSFSPDMSPVSNRKCNSPSPTLPSKLTSPVLGNDYGIKENGIIPTTHEPVRLTNGKHSVKNLASDSDDGEDDIDSPIKHISISAMENIRKDGMSLQFSFSGMNNSSNKLKNYLPLEKNQVMITDKVSTKPTMQIPTVPKISPFPSSRSDLPQTKVKQVGVILPIPLGNNKIPTSPPTPPVLSNIEKEKNHINRVKSVEQSSVDTQSHGVVLESVNGDTYNVANNKNNKHDVESVFSSVSELKSGLWDKKKPWNQQENTMVFNFSGTKKPVPDYIENDGLILSNRGKREKSRVGDSLCAVVLTDFSTDESSDYADDDPSLPRSPSPCNMVVIGGNVLINGKSSMHKKSVRPKQMVIFLEQLTSCLICQNCKHHRFPERSDVHKVLACCCHKLLISRQQIFTRSIDNKTLLRVSFNDSMTSVYEYPSEIILQDELQNFTSEQPSAPSSLSSSGPTPVLLGLKIKPPVPRKPYIKPRIRINPWPVGGSSLASYTPSKVHLGSDDFQLGVTRTAPLIPRVPSPSKVTETKEEEEVEDYLKPADDEDTVTWSAETAADLLF